MEQATFHARGITASDPTRQLALENIGQTFIGGYNAGLAADDVEEILQHVRATSDLQRGFAAEGAAMGTAVADILPSRRSRLGECVRALEGDFTYLVHVGVGWALARIPWRRRQILAPLDPVHCWLAFDGLGFHDTYFYHRRVLAGWRRRRSGYAERCYDQGIGRALWFVAAGSAENAIRLISAFPGPRQSDLWSGLGLAMAYAGPISDDEIVGAFQAAGVNETHFAQGIAFACEARVLARCVPAHTDRAARAVWGIDAETLSHLVRRARGRLPEIDGDPPRYELWRRSVAAALSSLKGQQQ